MFDGRFSAIRNGVHKLVERATTSPTWFGRALIKSRETVKAHPFAVVGVALALGYVIVRAVRRR